MESKHITQYHVRQHTQLYRMPATWHRCLRYVVSDMARRRVPRKYNQVAYDNVGKHQDCAQNQ
jgi:hypothetical protein